MNTNQTPKPLTPGDRVTLEPAGPAMTVASIESTSGKVYCTWSDGRGHQQFRGFRHDALRRVDAADE